MPRGQRRSIDDQMNALKEQLDKYRGKVKELEDELDALVMEKKSMEVDTLYNFISANSLSIDDAMSILETRLQENGTIA